eukprot:5322782-Amphidinium_carterae.1
MESTHQPCQQHDLPDYSLVALNGIIQPTGLVSRKLIMRNGLVSWLGCVRLCKDPRNKACCASINTEYRIE